MTLPAKGGRVIPILAIVQADHLFPPILGFWKFTSYTFTRITWLILYLISLSSQILRADKVRQKTVCSAVTTNRHSHGYSGKICCLKSLVRLHRRVSSDYRIRSELFRRNLRISRLLAGLECSYSRLFPLSRRQPNSRFSITTLDFLFNGGEII